MAGYRDDSAGGYGQWNDDDLSWLDYLKAKGSDIGGGAYNAFSNITGALSPIGTSPEGNMSLQVPPMVSGIADSYARLAGTPSQPGNAYSLSGVPELDAPIQQDMSNVLLSLYGGNALNPLARRPAGSVGSGMGEAATQPVRAYHGTMADIGDQFSPSPRGDLGPGFYAAFENPSSRIPSGARLASEYAGATPDGRHGLDGGKIYPLDFYGKFATEDQWLNAVNAIDPNGAASLASKATQERARDSLMAQGYTGAKRDSTNELVSWTPNTVRSATTGETLFSDTGKPSIFGSAAATAGEQPNIPYWLKF